MDSLFSAEEWSSRLRFEVGGVYHRLNDLHEKYGGQRQGGISTPADYALVFLFASKEGKQYGYRDEFQDDGTFWYTGEGQTGDMTMERGNKAIRSHRSTGKELHLFSSLGSGLVRYVGQAFYLDHHWEERLDQDGKPRRAIVFELEVETYLPEDDLFGEAGKQVREKLSGGDNLDRPLSGLSMNELRQAAIQLVDPSASQELRRRSIRRRSEAIRRYVFARADGWCEGCEKEAPFVTTKGRPYLEAHHIRRLADEGPDHPRWVIALCPTCHRMVHHGEGGEEYNMKLAEYVKVAEDQ